MKKIKYTDRYILLGRSIDGYWAGPQKAEYSRQQLVTYLSQYFTGQFNRSRGEFEVNVYRVPEDGLHIRQRAAAKKHRIFHASYMTAAKLCIIGFGDGHFRWYHDGGCRPGELALEVAVPPLERPTGCFKHNGRVYNRTPLDTQV